MWHAEPKNDAWREVHLAHVEGLGNRLWLRCNACGQSITPDPREFAHLHHLDMRSPLLSIAHCLRSPDVANCRPQPYRIGIRRRAGSRLYIRLIARFDETTLSRSPEEGS